jgi:glycosyltransferase involved in cell wall biosynthesis
VKVQFNTHLTLNKMQVSVVIPCYQHGALLSRAVNSALECGAAEVVIVNDASTDNTDIVGQQYHREDERVLYLRNPFHAGVIYSRNRAIHAATYDLILPLDADDMLLNIGALVEAWQPGTWVYGGWQELEYSAPSSTKVVVNNIAPPPSGMLHGKELGWVSMLFSKGDWLDVGGYNPIFSLGNEIWAFQRALCCAGVKPVRIPDIVFERNTDAPNTDRARAWAHVIKPLIDDLYPYREGVR